MPVSQRHKVAARRESEGAPVPTQEYEITDPHHMPDLHGELAGGKVYWRNGKQYVRLTVAQAKFYLDSGSLRLVG